MTLSNMRGLHHPVRPEREAQLEAENEVMRGVLERLSYHYDNQDMSHLDYRVFVATQVRGTLAALSTTASKGGGDE